MRTHRPPSEERDDEGDEGAQALKKRPRSLSPSTLDRLKQAQVRLYILYLCYVVMGRSLSIGACSFH